MRVLHVAAEVYPLVKTGGLADVSLPADASCAGKLVLPQASGLSGGSHNVADLGGGEVASGHDIYRTGKYHGFRKHVYKNFPLGKACASG